MFLLFESTEQFVLPGTGINSHLPTHKPKVFVTEGKEVALTGVCIFFIRSSLFKPITTENIYQVRVSDCWSLYIIFLKIIFPYGLFSACNLTNFDMEEWVKGHSLAKWTMGQRKRGMENLTLASSSNLKCIIAMKKWC